MKPPEGMTLTQDPDPTPPGAKTITYQVGVDSAAVARFARQYVQQMRRIIAAYRRIAKCPCGRPSILMEVLAHRAPHRCKRRPPRAVRHPAMASKPHVPIKPSARSRRRTR